MADNNEGCPMPLGARVKHEGKEIVKGEIKSFIFWKTIALIMFAWSSWQAIPQIQKSIKINQAKAGYGELECISKRTGALIHTLEQSDCKPKTAKFLPFDREYKQ